MKHKNKRLSLKEQFAPELADQTPVLQPPTSLDTRSLVEIVSEPWSGESYGELMSVVAMLKGLYTMAQSAHWSVTGKAFFGDHQLLQAIYEGIDLQVDSVGEKAAGLSEGVAKNPHKLLKASATFVEVLMERETNSVSYRPMRSTTEAQLQRLKFGLSSFLQVTEELMESISQRGEMTKGLDNLLAGVLDEHEKFVYLLNQRLSSTT